MRLLHRSYSELTQTPSVKESCRGDQAEDLDLLHTEIVALTDRDRVPHYVFSKNADGQEKSSDEKPVSAEGLCDKDSPQTSWAP